MDPRRLRSAAAQHPYLRGLVSVPAGLLFIVCALGNWAWGPFAHAWVFVVALLLIAAACAAVNRYYNEHYGRVTPSTRQQIRAAGVALVIGVSALLRSRAGLSLDLPVNPIPIAFAVLMLAYAAAVSGLRPHHVVIWGSLFVAAALPVWTGDDPANIGLVMCGVAVMVNGVFDHLALVRTFGPATPSLGRG